MTVLNRLCVAEMLVVEVFRGSLVVTAAPCPLLVWKPEDWEGLPTSPTPTLFSGLERKLTMRTVLRVAAAEGGWQAVGRQMIAQWQRQTHEQPATPTRVGCRDRESATGMWQGQPRDWSKSLLAFLLTLMWQ